MRSTRTSCAAPGGRPAAPDGDRLVGYALLSNGVNHEAIGTFLMQLKAAGIEPAEVITDDSRMYPTVLAEIWPTAAHQLCLFHATRNVVKAVNEVVKKVRRTIPVPPPPTPPSLKGRVRYRLPRPDELRRTRYRGFKKTHLDHVATAAALNCLRLGDWLADRPRAKTRSSPFGRLFGAAS